MAMDNLSLVIALAPRSGSLGCTFEGTADARETDGSISQLGGARGAPHRNDILAEPDIARAVDADGGGELAVPQVEKHHRTTAENSPLDDFVARFGDARDLQVPIELIAPEPRHLGVRLGSALDVPRHGDRLVLRVLPRFEANAASEHG